MSDYFLYLNDIQLKLIPDKERPLLMGPWFRTKASSNLAETISPWDLTKIDQTYNFLTEKSEQLLSILSLELNRVHNLNYSVRFWRVLIGQWCIFFTHSVYDRYIRVLELEKKNLTFQAEILDKKNFFIPEDGLDFVSGLFADELNYQIFSIILELLQNDKVKRREEKYNFNLPKKKPKGTLFLVALFKFTLAISKFLNRQNITVIHKLGFSRSDQLKIFLKSGAKIVPTFDFSYYDPQLSQTVIDFNSRFEISNKIADSDQFSKCLSRLFVYCFPKTYLENFKIIYDQADKIFNICPKLISSSTGWYYDDYFKFWAAKSQESVTAFIGHQHGGNYESYVHNVDRDHELNISKYFVSWGWKDFSLEKVRPLPSIKLSKDLLKYKKNNNSDFLLGLTFDPDYFFVLPYIDTTQKRYDYLFTFLNGLEQSVLKKIRARKYQHNNDKWLEEKLASNFPHLNFDDTKIQFIESLSNSSLYICDHLSTTYLEALACMHPTILFWDLNLHVLSPNYLSDLKELEKVNVFFPKPELAAKFLNDLIKKGGSIEEWWKENERQKVVKAFANKYSKASDDFLVQWSRFLTDKN